MKNTKTFLYFICLLAIVACKKKDDPAPVTNVYTDSATVTKAQVVENYATLVHATYQDAYTQALQLKESANIFLADPSESKLSDLKKAYLAARVPYEQSEAFRFCGGPIDGDNDPEALINSWPLDELFIDYVVDSATAGIINHLELYPIISKDILAGANTSLGETDVSTGYHAIEFLLWGQDLSNLGPGDRPYTDYLLTGGTAAHQDRRILYLQTVIDLLIDNLTFLVNAWEPNQTSNYRAGFVAAPDASLALLISGTGKFAKGELAGERMTVALASQDKEDEHSCFSDDTHHDIVYGNQSIYNVYTGTYVRTNGSLVSGPSLSKLVRQSNASVDADMLKLLVDAQNKTLLIQPPFDQEILGSNPDGRVRIQNAINAIKAEGDKLVLVASTIDISLTIPDSND
ncbi:MAG: hypothetical protein JWO58_2675 [Chitinophagaceae bacterium]|nr:hypothetical protein [Chitinophagaceae bacterium]